MKGDCTVLPHSTVKKSHSNDESTKVPFPHGSGGAGLCLMVGPKRGDLGGLPLQEKFLILNAERVILMHSHMKFRKCHK